MLAVCAQAQHQIRFDYTLYVHIDTEPAGAQIISLAATNAENSFIGRTPHVTAVGMDWERILGKRVWRKINVTSAGSAFQAEYREDNTYDIMMKCRLEKDGYYPLEINEPVATVNHPGFSWDGTKDWPADVYINLVLDKKPVARRVEKKTKPVPSVIIASDRLESADLGTVRIRCENLEAEIYIDGRKVGPTPMDVMLPEGPHRVELRRNGYETFTRAIHIYSSRDLLLEAFLMPE
jgi:hypothetical protein